MEAAEAALAKNGAARIGARKGQRLKSHGETPVIDCAIDRGVPGGYVRGTGQIGDGCSMERGLFAAWVTTS